MLALIDLDPLPYTYGGLTFEDGTLMPDSLLQRMVDEKIQEIVERTNSDDWLGYLTAGPCNFRINLGTILPYKGNRSGNEKPPRYQMLRDYLMDKYPDKVTMVTGMEADDAVSIAQQGEDTIICSIDKDLRMVPGWHYTWSKGKSPEIEPWYQDEIGGLRFFYKQLLTGDMTDNILGLFGVGKKSALVSALDDMDNEQDMFLHVQEQYRKRFGNYADQFLLENGRLLWMLRDEDDMWEFPTINIEDEETITEF